jgi:hypothetical protein
MFPYVNVLGGNHWVAIAGTLGLLPLWVTSSEIESHKGRPLNCIYKRDYVIVTWLGHFFERICQLMT